MNIYDEISVKCASLKEDLQKGVINTAEADALINQVSEALRSHMSMIHRELENAAKLFGAYTSIVAQVRALKVYVEQGGKGLVN